jgi:hypothetical protein
VRAVRRAWGQLELGWRAGLRRLPFFTQRTAVLLVGVLVASLAMVGGGVALVGWPGANGPTHLVPGEQAGQLPESRPGPGSAAPGGPGAGDRSGADAGGAAAASPSLVGAARPASAGGAGAGRAAHGTQPPGGTAAGARGSGGAAGAGAGGPPAAPPTTPPAPTTTTTIPPGPLDPVDKLLGPVVSTLLP